MCCIFLPALAHAKICRQLLTPDRIIRNLPAWNTASIKHINAGGWRIVRDAIASTQLSGVGRNLSEWVYEARICTQCLCLSCVVRT